MNKTKSVISDNMRIEWDVEIPMADGIALRADVFRPIADGKYPIILSMGPYGKGLSFQKGYQGAWDRITSAYPDIAVGSTNKYQVWELVDPEKWVPDGYVVVRVDSRGAGRSPGFLEVWSPRETKDLYDCIEWLATRPWSNGKVGIHGISYYSCNQWQVAELKPPHLAAICVWEGATDYYRDFARHGGIYCEFMGQWFDRQVASMQYGVGERGPKSVVTGEAVAGPVTLGEAELVANRRHAGEDVLARHLEDEYYRGRTPDLTKITTPLLSSANWGGMGLHPRGNFEGFVNAASPQKWLEVHGNSHFAPFYRKSGEALQKRFFGHFLKGEATGWDQQPKVQLDIRHPGEKFVTRSENEWPLARTQWTRFYLDPISKGFSKTPVSGPSITYEAMEDGVTFSTPPLTEAMEITGPVAAKLFLSSKTKDADVFLALRLYDPDDKEVLFIGANDPHVPIALGWLRASHRKLDSEKTLPYRPYHTHDEVRPLTPDVPVELDVEVWPTCIVVPKGYRLALTIKGCDYDHGLGDLRFANGMYPMKGVGPFTHDEPRDRPSEVFGGSNTLHFEEGRAPFLLLPAIPADKG